MREIPRAVEIRSVRTSSCRRATRLVATFKEHTMKYLLMIYGNEAAAQAANKADIDQTHAAYVAYTETMKKAGILVGGERLHRSSSATTVRVANGKTQVLD